MSTTINVTVDDGGLPAKNRQQTAANRQAFVQGQASQQAAQQGADQRAADRRAAGLDPTTGRALASAGASSRLPRIEQEPAANRKARDLPFFYLKIIKATDSIPPSLQVVSGDGSKTLKHDFQYTTQIATARELSGDYDPKVGPWANIGVPQSWSQTTDSYTGYRVTVTFGETVFDTTTVTENYDSSREFDGADYSQLFCLPAGDGTALVVLFRQISVLAWRKDLYSVQIVEESAAAVISDTLQTYDYTSEIMHGPETLYEYAAFRVGLTTLTAVTLSQSFVNQLKMLFPVWQQAADVDSVNTGSCTSGANTCDGLYNTTFTRDDYYLDPTLDTSIDVTPQYIQLSDAGGYSVYALPYGISNQGVYENLVMATPMSWFGVDSLDNLATLTGTGDYWGDLQWATHEQVLDLGISGTSPKASDLLPPSRILGLPTDQMSFFGSIRSMTAGGSTYAWADPINYMGGRAAFATPGFTYPYNTSDNYWLASGPKFKAGLTSPVFESLGIDTATGWKRVVIYDWKQSGFCRQQAAKYGPYTPT